MRSIVARIAAAALAIVALGVGIRLLMDATLTRHTPVDPDTSLVVILDAEARGGAEHPLEELVMGLATLCRLEIAASLVPGSLEQLDDDLFRFVLRPTLDEADQRQFRGCLQDARVDHLLTSVVAMDEA